MGPGQAPGAQEPPRGESDKSRGSNGKYLETPFAVRECPPGMKIRGSIPLQKKRPTVQAPRDDEKEKENERVKIHRSRKNPEEMVKFDPTVEDLAPDAHPRTRVACFLTQFRRHVLFLKAEKKAQSLGHMGANGASSSGRGVICNGRVDIPSYKALKQYSHLVNGTKSIVGAVPGVEVGDLFVYRAELILICLHKQVQRGIDIISESLNRFQDARGKPVSAAVSVVASGGYSGNQDVALGSETHIGDGHVYKYSGEGGNQYKGFSRSISDQELQGGNCALRNSRDLNLLVRLIRRYPSRGLPGGLESLSAHIYRYDGIYKVTSCARMKPNPKWKTVYQYTLVREPGQPSLSLRKLEISGPWNLAPSSQGA